MKSRGSIRSSHGARRGPRRLTWCTSSRWACAGMQQNCAAATCGWPWSTTRIRPAPGKGRWWEMVGKWWPKFRLLAGWHQFPNWNMVDVGGCWWRFGPKLWNVREVSSCSFKLGQWGTGQWVPGCPMMVLEVMAKPSLEICFATHNL